MTPAQPTAAQQIAAINSELLKAFAQKHDAEAAVKKADETIVALRNALAGVQLGQQAAAEAVPPAPAAPPAA